MNTCGGSSDTSLSSWRTVVVAVGTDGACKRKCCQEGIRGPMGRGVVFQTVWTNSMCKYIGPVRERKTGPAVCV